MRKWRTEGGAVPPLIARCLGEEGSRKLARELEWHRDCTGDEILTIIIPSIVKHVMADREREAKEYAEDLQMERDVWAREIAQYKQETEHRKQSEEQAWNEWEKMSLEVAEANASVRTMHDVIARHITKS